MLIHNLIGVRILILGKDGMLGKDLVRAFGKEDLIALGFADLDITDRNAVFEKFMTIQPDVVINATGYTNVDLAEKEEIKADEVNGLSVGVLAQAAREIDATLVHFSSDYVFDGQKVKGYKEEDKTNPINAYGRGKELGEKLLIEEMELLYAEDDQIPEGFAAEDLPEGGKYFLIRTSWLFGKHGKNFVDTMLKLGSEQLKAGAKAKPLKVVNDQHGKPTYTVDLAEQVKWLVESHEYPSGIYHITNEKETTWFDFAKKIFDLANMPVNVVPCSSAEYVRPAARPTYSGLINNKLPPLRPWDEALKDYIAKL